MHVEQTTAIHCGNESQMNGPQQWIDSSALQKRRRKKNGEKKR